MKKYPNKILTVLLTLQLMAPSAWSQFDEEDDFPPPPPPPPPSSDFTPSPSGSGSFGRGSSGSGFGSSGSGSKGSNGPGFLSTEQKNKLAKAGIEEITNENFPETIESFDFPNADITDIVKAISELTGKNFIIDQGVRGKITIIAPTKITVAEAYKAFLSALAINGFAIVPSGSFLKIRTARNAQRDSIETYGGAYYPNSDQMITRIIHLKHISAEAVNRDLRILSSKDGEMSIYTPTNSVIISDYGSNIDRIMKIITQLDVQGFEDQLEVVPVKYAKAKDIADTIDKILNKGENKSKGGSFSAGVPRFSRGSGSTGSQGGAYFMVIPDDRTNSLIIVGNKAGIERIKKLLSQLDFKLKPEDAGGVYVYYVKYGEAEKISQTLSGIAKDAGPKASPSGGASAAGGTVAAAAQASQEIFGGDVKITADKGTNSLVILASKVDYEVVLNLLSRLDIPRDQVYVETYIVEMKTNDAAQFKVGYLKYDKSGAKGGFQGFSGTELQNLISPFGGSGAILGFGSSSTVDIKTATGQTVTVPNILSFVNFLKQSANANILSTPQILAMDNQEALIQVGDKVATSQTTTVSNGVPVQSTNFEEATIELKIKPFISPSSNSVRLEIDNSVKQPSTARAPTALQDTTLSLATRKIKTNIVVRNGDTAVLGGLMKEDDKEDILKVPLLGDIPIIGWLFKSRSTSKEKTNMLIFLSPRIIRSPEDSKNLLTKKNDERLDYIKSIGGRDPFGEKIDELTKRTGPDSAPAPESTVE